MMALSGSFAASSPWLLPVSTINTATIQPPEITGHLRDYTNFTSISPMTISSSAVNSSVGGDDQIQSVDLTKALSISIVSACFTMFVY